VTGPTVQLRRYELIPDQRAAFLEWWRRWIPPALEAYGLQVPFAYLVPETDEFVWAIAHPGDAEEFRRAEQEYRRSPQRATAFAEPPSGVREMLVHLVEAV
jgi:hypothetical protein